MRISTNFLIFSKISNVIMKGKSFNLQKCTVCKTLIATYQFFNSRYAHNDNIEMCNTAMEGEFCELSESVRLQNVRPLINSTD